MYDLSIMLSIYVTLLWFISSIDQIFFDLKCLLPWFCFAALLWFLWYWNKFVLCWICIKSSHFFFSFFQFHQNEVLLNMLSGVLIWCNKRQRGGWRVQSSKQKKDRLRIWTNYVPLVFRWRMQCSPLMKWRKDFGRKLFSFWSC